MRYFVKRRTVPELLFLGLGIVFLTVVLLSVFYQSNSKGKGRFLSDRAPENDSVEPGKDSSRVHLQQFFRVQVKDGRQTWEVQAADAKYFARENITYISDAKVKIFRAKRPPVLITARSARLTLEGDELRKADLQGEVVVMLDSETTVRTEFADFNEEARMLTAPGAVSVVGASFELKGVGMEMYIDRDFIRILDKVRSSFTKWKEVPSAFSTGGSR